MCPCICSMSSMEILRNRIELLLCANCIIEHLLILFYSAIGGMVNQFCWCTIVNDLVLSFLSYRISVETTNTYFN